MKAIQPYLTVIADSFHEAFASRVLYILLAVLTLFLLAIAPFGFREERALEFHINQVRDWQGLVTKIDEQARSSKPSPGAQIWKFASDEFKDAIEDAAKPPEAARPQDAADNSRNETEEASGDNQSGQSRRRGRRRGGFVDLPVARSIVDGLNGVLDEPKLYDAAAWPDSRLDPAAKKFLERRPEKLSGDELKQFNRLLVISAYRSRLEAGASEELYLAYGPWKIGNPMVTDREASTMLVTMVLGQVMAILVGVFGVFVAILVTAPIIPRTFEAGAVDLLMSKPVSRPLLFLAKFFGGCAFILLNAGYFVIGLWLIVGIRFGVWSGHLLLCIPIFLFLFAIYYCVSAAAGVLWKNAIVAVVTSIVFWAMCFAVGTTKEVIDSAYLSPSRIVKIAPSGGSLIAVNQAGGFHEWSAQTNDWTLIFSSGGPAGPGPFNPFAPMVIGPVFDESRQELIYLEQPPQGGGFALLGARTKLFRATEAPTWSRQPEIEAPSGASWLFLTPDNEPVVVALDGVYRLAEQSGGAEKAGGFLGIKLPFGGGAEPFQSIGPELSLAPRFAAAIDRDTGDLAIYSEGALTVLTKRDDKYVETSSRVLVEKAAVEAAPRESSPGKQAPEDKADPATEQAAIAISKDAVSIAFADGRIQVLDRGDLTTMHQEQPLGDSEPYAAIAAPGGAYFAVLFHSGRLWLYDVEGKRGALHGSDVSAATFDEEGRLLLAERWTRVNSYDPATMKVGEQRHPPAGILQTVYRYGIRPLYTVFPKPGELKNVVNYLLTDQDSTTMSGPAAMVDLRQTRIKIDVVTPIWSSLLFVVVMLGLTCWYVSRTDL